MKRVLTKTAVLFLFTYIVSVSTAHAQIPQAINFQAIARDGSGNPMTNTNIQIRLSVIDSAQSGSIVYQELRALQTNAYGSFSFQIGVSPSFTTIGTFQSIDWITGRKFLKIDYDPTNTFTFSLTLGTIEFVSVPYAFAAEKVVFIDATGAQNGDALVFNSGTGKFEPGQVTAGTVTWSNISGTPPNVSTFNNDAGYLTSFTEVDGSVTNELQTLSISNDTLYLTNGGYVKLPSAMGSTLLAPTATTQAATNVTITEATLNGIVNANGLSSSVIFEWGLTSSYGNTVIASPSPVTGSSNTAVSATLSSLIGNNQYHFRIKSINAVDVTYSSDMQFTSNMPNIPIVTTLNFSDIKGISAKAGGNITNNGGGTITAQGLCWSTSNNPTIANSYNTSFTDAMTSLSPNTTYYVRAYASNVAGTGYGNEISFNSGYEIGTIYAGGLVFYNDGVGHGLVCASSDQSAGCAWGCYGTAIGGTSTAINSGAANTNAIVAGCSTAGIAAKICYDLILGGYSDWYLPSRDELTLMYVNLQTQALGGFDTAYGYWSSSEYSTSTLYSAWANSFSGSSPGFGSKDFTYLVRAVRTF